MGAVVSDTGAGVPLAPVCHVLEAESSLGSAEPGSRLGGPERRRFTDTAGLWATSATTTTSQGARNGLVNPLTTSFQMFCDWPELLKICFQKYFGI